MTNFKDPRNPRSSAAIFVSAHALFGRHKSNQPSVHRAKKNASPYAYLAPKKQKKASGYYRSTLTGELVYGKKK